MVEHRPLHVRGVARLEEIDIQSEVVHDAHLLLVAHEACERAGPHVILSGGGRSRRGAGRGQVVERELVHEVLDGIAVSHLEAVPRRRRRLASNVLVLQHAAIHVGRPGIADEAELHREATGVEVLGVGRKATAVGWDTRQTVCTPLGAAGDVALRVGGDDVKARALVTDVEGRHGWVAAGADLRLIQLDVNNLITVVGVRDTVVLVHVVRGHGTGDGVAVVAEERHRQDRVVDTAAGGRADKFTNAAVPTVLGGLAVERAAAAGRHAVADGRAVDVLNPDAVAEGERQDDATGLNVELTDERCRAVLIGGNASGGTTVVASLDEIGRADDGVVVQRVFAVRDGGCDTELRGLELQVVLAVVVAVHVNGVPVAVCVEGTVSLRKTGALVVKEHGVRQRHAGLEGDAGQGKVFRVHKVLGRVRKGLEGATAGGAPHLALCEQRLAVEDELGRLTVLALEDGVAI
eukprot:PhM_4_TR14642/c0_g1_i1/m.62164